MACAQIAKKPNSKAYCVNRPAEDFGSQPNAPLAALVRSRQAQASTILNHSRALPTKNPAQRSQNSRRVLAREFGGARSRPSDVRVQPRQMPVGSIRDFGTEEIAKAKYSRRQLFANAAIAASRLSA